MRYNNLMQRFHTSRALVLETYGNSRRANYHYQRALEHAKKDGHRDSITWCQRDMERSNRVISILKVEYRISK